MGRDTIRFTRRPCPIFGPAWIIGGLLAAFTTPGAIFVFTGTAMIVTSGLMYARVHWLMAAVAGASVFAGLTVWMLWTLAA